MGKSKILKDSNRRVTFNKRRLGLLKKAYEMSILCEVDIALILISQNGEMTCFEGPHCPTEEVVKSFANIPPNERTRSHVQKYIGIEEQLGNSMPRKIENEEAFQEIVRDLYQSYMVRRSSLKYERAPNMGVCNNSSVEGMMDEIREKKIHLGAYDLSVPLSCLLSSDKDILTLELYVRKQLERIEIHKRQLLSLSHNEAGSWINAHLNNRGITTNTLSSELGVSQNVVTVGGVYLSCATQQFEDANGVLNIQ
ncbi:hypothetical protein KP509_16G005300 [Ceratopteris richardii]|uniref:MADS-box domain-containing protein n=1 Tax=Ceratopteris richardii TaxID=49495 RepID=A0A8T2SXV2_CERRI|nr:hypothetical protein KP509_16G005300 [Ceratopteris richardii]